MKRTVNGKRYDTEAATLVATDSYSQYGDLDHWCEELYRTKKGAWFLYGEGNARSQYARRTGQNEVSGGSTIIPFSDHDALAWLEAHTEDSGIYESYFTDVIEDA